MVPGSALRPARPQTPQDAALVRCRVTSHGLSLRLERGGGVSAGLLHFPAGNAARWRHQAHRIIAAGPGASSAAAALKQVDAGLLRVGYAEAGPADGRAVVLLHGWSYDIHSYAEVAPPIGSGGVPGDRPYLRGYGTTRFLSDATLRNSQQSVLGTDVIALMDALGVPAAIIGGFDWGPRTANVAAALWPGRCKAMVSVSVVVSVLFRHRPRPGWL
jgi:hypothetical protein